MNSQPVRYDEGQYEIDNRDLGTTWLTLPDGTTLEVNPWKLLSNAIENAIGERDFRIIDRQLDLLNDLVQQILEGRV